MNYKEYNIHLPIKDNNVPIIQGIIQYDTANIVNVRLMDGTVPFDFTGWTNVFLEIDKPDGTHIQACVTDNPEITGDNNPYTIQIVDAKEGRISFTLQGQATILTGTHFAQIFIMAGGKKLTSARVNYYVEDTLSEDTDPTEVVSSGEYSSLQNMINQCSTMSAEERVRIDSETQRKLAEQQREIRIRELEDEVQAYLDRATGYVDETETYMELARKYMELAQNPSAEILADLISSLNLASETYVNDTVSVATHDFDAGNYTDTDIKRLKVRRGLSGDIPDLALGELGFSTDTNQAYIGGMGGNIPIGGVYEAGPSAPTRTDILWIDTSAGNATKFHDGTGWVPTATAAFA